MHRGRGGILMPMRGGLAIHQQGTGMPQPAQDVAQTLTTADLERDAFDQLPFMIQQRYRRDRKLGSGGMGVVYRYYDEKLDRFLAVKALAPERAIDPLWRERFLQEAKTLAALVHQNIGAIFDLSLIHI